MFPLAVATARFRNYDLPIEANSDSISELAACLHAVKAVQAPKGPTPSRVACRAKCSASDAVWMLDVESR
eukprot:CAMPEP_0197932900 /NCGR_PEP_ID=MMETSP1439-20131203/109302_1 /TAXON_ID=66791 /ORGANISM="Gonyaulax spinifera, Strain CCMP409" /LENGTH=69 /DNA_ID=CAMNT_0043555705 /DNA_START=23 /DNA_END=229 /DNA_ORIENTATION=-